MELINVEELCEKLQNCSSKEQVYRVWEKAKLTNDCSMFVIGNASNVEFVEGFNDIFSNELVCDYFQSKKIQFVNNSIINKLENKKVPEIFIDYSLMFDSNICTYINAIMKRKEFEGSKK
ncbi:hypothetical protein ES754_01860 [Psychrobacter frigidicola]|uniref:Uncharacterized protein n=1 Tax=Psychrobacter frigidicola TaxID=45611 RepID=A0A5C7A2G6_9GAMM|nr:hypothetical protein [Psychrobacter frigidicola]TXD97747.1 hypothetical protein ES754_01860 [Psychrobacter frigidicola]